MATYKQLLAEKEKLEAQLEEARQTEVATVIAQIQQLMEDYGLTAEDLAPRRRGRPRKSAARSGTPAPAKYRDPKTGKTWSGRGRAPAWLGKNRDRFLITE
ncbi:H-NS histone family protein [Cupriavidus gilardii]|uniref:H-NS histone family protein n=1 Tax=Cupriavidus gilardii TaxID=82541 RepID=A0A6N1BAL3_9BURK|nr:MULTISPECIES: H-NS histone family protein [Cupriavidus]ALD93546.1 histone family protein nucleoid-structuring protein H-NS [Cupriavidus gilardii CR3]QQE08862.1 H-NS histone family protein [Cupriavidus sp. ISTL7]KAB0595576.1 H-NS histone family protein [Cupriavidus gilardii]MCD9119537.1 H-NS histone family protein [Cupriavidus sp. UGS-1]MCT9013463.1 H-NS histone family protein [Cupriavidus gilardii]